MEGPAFGLSQQPIEAGGSLTLGAQGRVGAASTTPGRVRTARWPRVRQARRRGVRMQEPVVEPPEGVSRLEPGGCGPVGSARPSMCTRTGDFGSVVDDRGGGHGEGLRRSRGEAAGEKLGADTVDRSIVNVGTASGRPSAPSGQGGAGKARCQLTARWWDGALVVVRGRESRPHGEGGQQLRKRRVGTSGGRW